MAASATCEWAQKKKNVNYVVLQYSIHRPPHGLHDLMVLDDETIEWLLNTFPEIYCGQAVDSNNSLKRRRQWPYLIATVMYFVLSQFCCPHRPP